jgi:probable F420-dependent oxidoreductase
MEFWCATAWMDPRQLIGVAQLLDEAGYHGLMVSDHLVYPRDVANAYPYSATGEPPFGPDEVWPDPWVQIAAMAAVTRRIRFTTNIYVAPMRPLLSVAKQVGTAAVLSDGRVALGAGAGWMREEFDLQGQEFGNRGKRLDEMILALRELWNGGWTEYHGDHYDLPPLTMEPHPVEPVPIYVGGHSEAALRRAARLGDGWIGNAYPWDDAAEIVGRLRGYLAEYGRDGDRFEIICGLLAMPEPELFHRAESELGITGMLCRPWALDTNITNAEQAGSPLPTDAYRESIERFAAGVLRP